MFARYAAKFFGSSSDSKLAAPKPTADECKKDFKLVSSMWQQCKFNPDTDRCVQEAYQKSFEHYQQCVKPRPSS